MKVVEEYGLCQVCLKGFTERAWEERHTTLRGEDCHARCCDVCHARVQPRPETVDDPKEGAE